MLYRSISVAVILLLSWFVYISMQATQRQHDQLDIVKLSIAESAERVIQNNLQTNKKIDEIQSYVLKQKQLSKEKKQVEGKLWKQKRLTHLHASYSKVINAELLRSNKRYSEAAKLLKSTKKDIWKAGDNYPDKQKVLRALMPAIDMTVTAWRQNDAEASAKTIYLTLDKIIQEKGK